jgi:hypothetical protein
LQRIDAIMAKTMKTIAIVTSSSYGGSNKACFQAGLVSSLDKKPQPIVLAPFEANGNYNTADLRALVKSAVNNNPRPDLIVAAGGPEITQAVALELREQDPKFIFLSTVPLEGASVALVGGVTMNTPGQDDFRRALLRDSYKSVQDESMYLVVNNNSPAWRSEAKNWPDDRIAKFFEGIDNPPTNKQTKDADNNFIGEFSKLAQRRPAPTGLVITADPYFRHFRTAFTIALAEKLPIPVCYPFQEFVDVSADTRNEDNSIAVNKPPLNNSSDISDQTTAYFQLGKQVGRFIGGVSKVGVVTWNGSQWGLQSAPTQRAEKTASPEREPEASPEVFESSMTKRMSVETSGIEIEVLKIRVNGRIDESVLQKLLAAFRGAA